MRLRGEVKAPTGSHLALLHVLTSIVEFEFDDLRKSDNFEHDFYFVAQLYDMEWKPSSTV